MAIMSHDEYMRNKKRIQQVEQALVGRGDAQRVFGFLRSILPAESMAQVPLLAACWGASDLVRVFEERGYPFKSRLHQAPGIPFVSVPGISDDEAMGIGIAQVAVRQAMPDRSILANLRAIAPFLAALEVKERQKQLNSAVMDILGNYPKMSLDKAHQDMEALRYLRDLGAGLAEPALSRKAARLAATYCVILGEAKDRREAPERELAMLDTLALLEAMGVRHDDLCAYTHARAIIKDYKRYTHRSSLPMLCRTLIGGGYELSETAVMGRNDSPLANMIAFGLVRGVETMLNQDPRLDWQSPYDGSTLLMVASGGKRSTLEAMALISVGSFKPIANFCNNDGETALHLAVRRMSAPMVKRCFQEGVDPTIANKNNKTAFDLLASGRGKNAQENFDEIMTLFKEHGYGGVGHGNSQLALHAAARALSVGQVREMILAGADMRKLDRRGDSPMEMALARQPSLHGIKSIRQDSEKQFQIVQCFLDAGYDINELHGKGCTMLQMAAKSKRWILARQLLETGADATICDDDGNHPFQDLANTEPYNSIDYLVRGQEQALIAIARHLIATDPAFLETGDNDRLAALRRSNAIWQAIEANRLEVRLDRETAVVAPSGSRGSRPRL